MKVVILYMNIIHELINGKVKEYDDESKFRFEGEYSSRKRNGKVKEYDLNGVVKNTVYPYWCI